MARVSVLLLLLLLVSTMEMELEAAERVNKSALGETIWSATKEETNVVPMPSTEDDAAGVVVEDHDDMDGGFPTLDSMLNWAIGDVSWTECEFHV